MIQNVTDFTPNKKIALQSFCLATAYQVFKEHENLVFVPMLVLYKKVGRPFIPAAEDRWVFWTQRDKTKESMSFV